MTLQIYAGIVKSFETLRNACRHLSLQTSCPSEDFAPMRFLATAAALSRTS